MTSEDGRAFDKQELRVRVLASRAVLDPAVEAERAESIAGHVVSLVESQRAETVAAYVSLRGEPGTEQAIERLHALGATVILPLLREDLDLDWAPYEPGQWRPGRFGLVEPTAPPRGLNAVQEAELILCPGVAGTTSGRRLGRGGGSYDRALARALPASLRCLLLYDDEVLDDVPSEPHDQLVDALITPSALIPVLTPRVTG